MILCRFQVSSIMVSQSYTLQGVAPDISSTQLTPLPYVQKTAVIIIELTKFLQSEHPYAASTQLKKVTFPVPRKPPSHLLLPPCSHTKGYHYCSFLTA